jgi:hypothetical protein
MKLQPIIRDADGALLGYRHWCPGCGEMHGIYTNPQALRSGRFWTFDGDLQAPTFSPELVFSPSVNADRCRYSITAGNVIFAADSTHALAGQTVQLPDVPAGQ